MLSVLGQEAVNLVILIIAATAVLGIDLYLWVSSRKTFSETIWGVNQKTLALAFGVGVIIGHLFTVPR